MKKVFTVWYLSELAKGAHLWGIYETEEKAQKVVDELRGDNWQYSAWLNEEEVLQTGQALPRLFFCKILAFSEKCIFLEFPAFHALMH